MNSENYNDEIEEINELLDPKVKVVIENKKFELYQYAPNLKKLVDKLMNKFANEVVYNDYHLLYSREELDKALEVASNKVKQLLDLEIKKKDSSLVVKENSPKDIIKKAKSLKYVERIDFLVNELGEYETDEIKSIEFFDAFILLSDSYLFTKQGEKAFKAIVRASHLVSNINDKFDYLYKHFIIAEKSASICLSGQTKPQYADYLYYSIVAFILEVIRDVVTFHFNGFFHRKTICFDNEWGFSDSEDFDNAIKFLNIYEFKKELINDIYDYTFHKLPLEIGIPEKFLKPNIELTREFLDFQETFNKKPFEKIVFINKFAGEVIKKYYDKTNND